jgi:hypothetical protein
MGIAWSDRVAGDRGENVERALECYTDALEVYTREAAPHDWATVRMNMGNAWSDRVAGDRGENMERALECYDDALLVWTSVASPREFLLVQHNRAVTLRARAALNVLLRDGDMS